MGTLHGHRVPQFVCHCVKVISKHYLSFFDAETRFCGQLFRQRSSNITLELTPIYSCHTLTCIWWEHINFYIICEYDMPIIQRFRIEVPMCSSHSRNTLKIVLKRNLTAYDEHVASFDLCKKGGRTINPIINFNVKKLKE